MKFLKCSEKKCDSGKSVAIVGGGVAGLTAAGELICEGHKVEVYDEMPEPGGFLIFGISSHEISRDGVRERIDELKKVGVNFHNNSRVGKDVDLEGLIKEHDAVLITTGTWKYDKVNISGGDLDGVYYAIDFMKKYNLREMGHDAEVPQLSGNVGIVIPKISGEGASVGGDLVTVDVVPMVFIQGAHKITIIYKGTRLESKSSEENFNYIENYYLQYSPEKLEIMEFTQPFQFTGDNNKVSSIEAIKTRLEENKIVEVDGSEFSINVDNILISTPPSPAPPFESGKYGIELNDDGTIKTDKFYRTGREKVFAAGNARHGPRYLIPAMRSARSAANSINKYLETGSWAD
ncbi:MAG: FAD-dependent oxidoreductase [Archaeoglobaceae archaeon]